jgi:Invasin, domain 3/Bacterial Ig-like domain (group 3)
MTLVNPGKDRMVLAILPKPPARRVLDMLLALSATALSCWVFASAAAAAGSPVRLTLRLSQTLIAANGKAKTTATASVTDATGKLVPGQAISLRSSDGRGWRMHRHGRRYVVKITSSRKAGAFVITAHDRSKGTPDAYATLIQYGRAKQVSVSLSPPVILSDNTSFTTATATVTDAHGNPVPGDAVSFTSSDPGQTPGPTTNHHDGTYTARIRSSARPGQSTITAMDRTAKTSGRAILSQQPNASTTTLMVPQSPVLTNQPVTLLAEIASSAGSASGTMSFSANGAAIPGCTAEPIAPADTFAVCQTSFSVSSSPEQLTAVFTPDSLSNVAGSVGAAALTVSRDGTSTALSSSRSFATVGESVSYTAVVSPTHHGPLQPSGAVQFKDNGRLIRSCVSQPLQTVSGSAAARCTVRYDRAGTHRITGTYDGDVNFNGSPSNVVPLPVQVLGTIEATMQWTFRLTHSYTTVLSLKLNGAPAGTSVGLSCQGGGCPFARRAITVHKLSSCPAKTKCRRHRIRTVNLAQALVNHRLRAGAHLVVAITRPGWIGKRYLFAIRANRWPHVQIACLAPGAARPGVGC